MKSKGSKWKIRIGQISLIIFVLAVIEILVDRGVSGIWYLPAPTSVIKELFNILSGTEWLKHLVITLQEFIYGFGLAVILGIGVGLALVLVPKAEPFFGPFLSAFMAIPKVTLVPLFMLWLGIGITHKVAIVFLFCFFTIAFNTIAGVKQTAEQHLKVAKVFKASRLQTIVKVILPSAAPTIFASLRVAAAMGLVGALFGEMMASKGGLGNLLVQATSLYDFVRVFAIITIVTLLSVIIVSLIDLLERKVFLKWRSS